MPLPPPRTRRLELQLNEEIVEQAQRRWGHLEAKIEELLAGALAAEAELEERSDAAAPFTEMNPEVDGVEETGARPMRKWDRKPVLIKRRKHSY